MVSARSFSGRRSGLRLALALWLGMLAGVVSLPLAFDALAWHQHEMLFGYVGGVLAGFLLTAIPNWTGRPPMSGLPLLGLVLLWAAARSLNLLGAATGPWLPAAADVGFCVVLVGTRPARDRRRPQLAQSAGPGASDVLCSRLRFVAGRDTGLGAPASWAGGSALAPSSC